MIDIETVKEHFAPGGTYAVEGGAKVAKLRKELNVSHERLAAECGVTSTTIRSIESGALLPRDYLRALIACELGQDVDYFWPTLRRARIKEMAA